MRLLSDGGLGHDLAHPSMANNEDRQLLANARRDYAQQLKDRFLGSAARFLLRDQDAGGIARLEGRLLAELDLALRFSVQAWSRVAPLVFVGLSELLARGHGFRLATAAENGDETAELCANQKPLLWRDCNKIEEAPIAMVIQPAIGVRQPRQHPGQGRGCCDAAARGT